MREQISVEAITAALDQTTGLCTSDLTCRDPRVTINRRISLPAKHFRPRLSFVSAPPGEKCEGLICGGGSLLAG